MGHYRVDVITTGTPAQTSTLHTQHTSIGTKLAEYNRTSPECESLSIRFPWPLPDCPIQQFYNTLTKATHHAHIRN